MSRRQFVRAGILLFLLVVVTAGLWTGWQVWNVNRDMRAALTDATALEAALEAGDEQGANAALADLTAHSSSAVERTQTRTWSVLGRLPWFGDDAHGVRLVADVVHDLSRGGLAPLVAESADLEAMLPKGGRVPLDRLVALQEPVAQASEAFATADGRLGQENPEAFVDPLESKYRDLTRRVSDAAEVLSAADTALQLMPEMLGQSAPRDYLLVFQNNAEVRATGGLPGAVSVLHADAGALNLTRHVATSSLGATDDPVLPLTSAERQIYGEQLGTFFLDANFTPAFPRTAELMKARWEQVFDDQISGVLSVDPVALSYMLEATGPVRVGDTELTSDNVVQELLHEVYLRYPNPADQDEFFRQTALAVFQHVTSGAGDPRTLLRALARAGDEHRIYLHSFTQEEQAALSERRIAGELVMDSTVSPQVGVYLNDATGAKMSYFLRTTVRVDSTSCASGSQLLAGTARFRSIAPTDAGATLPDYVTGGGVYGTEPGTQLVAVRLYAPVGGSVDKIMLNSKPLRGTEIVTHETRPVASVYVSLKPQQTLDLTWRMSSPADQTGDVQVLVTPGVEGRDLSSVAASSC